MNTSSPWVRFLAAVVGTAVALRLVVDLLAPIAGDLLVALALAGVVLVVRWWRNNRW